MHQVRADNYMNNVSGGGETQSGEAHSLDSALISQSTLSGDTADILLSV